jgi:hypothetical protein
MSTLLLPRLGVGNPVAFNNNFSVSKDGNPWSDGGADTFDGTSGVQISTPGGWALLGGTAYSAADDRVQLSQAFANGVLDVGVYAGWVTAGIFACEVELGYQPDTPVALRFACNTGYDNAAASGIATRAFAIGQSLYELKTVWTTNKAQDAWRSTGETQLTVTVVPYLAAQNLAGANPFTWSGVNDDRDHRLDDVQFGATMYIQWGKVDLEAVQSWIIGDLVEVEDLSGAPHERLQLAHAPPGVRHASLAHWHSPSSDRWSQPGGYDTSARTLQHLHQSRYFAGKGEIAGTVKRKGASVDVPVARRVLLVDERAHVVVQETWSDAQTGVYRFTQLNPELRYLVIAYDHTRQYRAVVADRLQAELPAKVAAHD